MRRGLSLLASLGGYFMNHPFILRSLLATTKLKKQQLLASVYFLSSYRVQEEWEVVTS